MYRRWWLIVIPTLITLLWALPAFPESLVPPKTYSATIRFSAAAPPDAVNALAAASNSRARSGTYEDTAYVPWLASEYLAVNLPQWVTSSYFAAEVSDVLATQSIDIGAGDLRPAFAADSTRSILVVYFGWDNEAELEKIVAAAITVLQTRNQQYFPQLASTPATIQPLDEIEIVRTAPPLTVRFRPFIRIFLGLVAGIGLAFLADYLDDTVHGGDDLEKLGLAIIGIVPKE
jgi:hypothetical protein